jgi:hypothetical protein
MFNNRKKLLKSIGVRKPEKMITSDDWVEISKTPLSEEFIREFKEQIYWTPVCKMSVLSESFIKEFKYEVNWPWISLYQKLSEDFIREFEDRLYWKEISLYQTLSSDFLFEFNDRIEWKLYFERKKVSFEIMKKYILKNNFINMGDFKTDHLSLLEKKEIENIIKLKTMFIK